MKNGISASTIARHRNIMENFNQQQQHKRVDQTLDNFILALFFEPKPDWKHHGGTVSENENEILIQKLYF
jgi:hypothetical protein